MAAKKKKAKRVSKAAPARGRAGAKVGATSQTTKKKPAKAAAQRTTKAAAPRPRSSTKGDAVGASAPAGAVGEGDTAPTFALPDDMGAEVSSAGLAGTPYV